MEFRERLISPARPLFAVLNLIRFFAIYVVKSMGQSLNDC